jgi:DNA polymerase elongation subunit (family B)
MSRTPINDRFAAYWDDPKKRENLNASTLTIPQGFRYSEFAFGFCYATLKFGSLPLDQVMSAAVGFRVEWFLIKQKRILGELIPRKMEQSICLTRAA